MLINFYIQLQKNPNELIRMIQNTPHSETISKQAREIYRGRSEASDIEKAWSVWLMTNGNFTGSPDGSWKWDNGTAGSHTGRVLGNKRNAMSQDLYQRIKYAQISSRDALEVIEQRDTPNTVFFLDPPYPGANQKHYRGFTFENYRKLLELLSGISGKFILTNYGSQTLKYFITKFNWDVSTYKGHVIVNRIKPGQKQFSIKKTELIVTNYKQPSIQQKELNFSNHGNTDN